MIDILAPLVEAAEKRSGVQVTNWPQVQRILKADFAEAHEFTEEYIVGRLKEFQFIRLLGAGCFGAVYKVAVTEQTRTR